MTKIPFTAEMSKHMNTFPRRRIAQIGAGTAHSAFLTSPVEGEVGGQIFACGHVHVWGVAEDHNHQPNFKKWKSIWMIGHEVNDSVEYQPMCSCPACTDAKDIILAESESYFLNEMDIGDVQYGGLAVGSDFIAGMCVSMGKKTTPEDQADFRSLNLIFCTSDFGDNALSMLQEHGKLVRPFIFSSEYDLGCSITQESSSHHNDPLLLDIFATGVDTCLHMVVMITDMIPRMGEYDRTLPQYVNGQITQYEQLLAIWQFVHIVSFTPDNYLLQHVHSTDSAYAVGGFGGVHSLQVDGTIHYHAWPNMHPTDNNGLFIKTFVESGKSHMFISEDMYVALAMCNGPVNLKHQVAWDDDVTVWYQGALKRDMYKADACVHVKTVFSDNDLLCFIRDIWASLYIKDFLSDTAFSRLKESHFLQ